MTTPTAWDMAVAGMDTAVFATLSNRAWLNDATDDDPPILGMFEAPWTAPPVGRVRTSLSEPSFAVRDITAAGINKGDRLRVENYGSFVVVDKQPDGSGETLVILRPQP